MCLWSAVTGVGEAQLNNSALFYVLFHPPFSDKGRGARERGENARSLEALAQNWHLTTSSTFIWPNKVKSQPRFSSYVTLMIWTLIFTVTLSLPGHGHFCVWLYPMSFLPAKIQPQIWLLPFCSITFPSLFLSYLHSHLLSPLPLPLILQ